MRYSLSLVVLSTGLVLASQSSFNVHDDLLAFPQYEVVFSKELISEEEVESLLSPTQSIIPTPDSKDIDSPSSPSPSPANPLPTTEHTYETLILHDQPYLCSIPLITLPTQNESSAAEARLEEAKELSRATAKGWELLSDLDGTCLYYISGWWSYSFCYDKDVTQFHQLPIPPGHSGAPVRDPSTAMYVLGRLPQAAPPPNQLIEDEFGNEISIRKQQPPTIPQTHTEMQIKGDTRYLVQHLDGGTTCDLTGKPRRIEIQYHCNAQGHTDRIGWIKEVTTCSYVMVIYTHRLCADVAFLPPKVIKAHAIECKAIVPEDELHYWRDMHSQEAERMSSQTEHERDTPENQPPKPLNVGGIIVGGQKLVGGQGNRLPLPTNWITTDNTNGQANPNPTDATNAAITTEIVAKARPRAQGGNVEVLDDERLRALDVDPDLITTLRKELEKISEGKGWQLEVVEGEGVVREIRGMIEDDDGGKMRVVAEEDKEREHEKMRQDAVVIDDEDEGEGSEETFKEEL